MKHLNTYKIFESKKDLPKKHGRIIYPFDRIQKIHDFFMYDNFNYNSIIKDGWSIRSNYNAIISSMWKLDVKNPYVYVLDINGTTDKFKKALESAKQHGIIYDDICYVIYDFDEDVYEKNKHLWTAKELGLL